MSLASALHRRLRLSSPVTRLSLRTGLAAAAAVAVSEIFQLGHGYWVIMTVFIVTKANLGGAVLRSKQRLLGTLLGALASLPLLLWLAGEPACLLAALTVVLALYGLLGQTSYFLVSTLITMAVFLLFGLMGADVKTMLSERILDTLLGAAIGTGFSMVILPDTARSRLRRQQAETLERLGQALEYLQGRRRGAPKDLSRYKSIIIAVQAGLAECAELYREAAHEPGRRRFLAAGGRINERLRIIYALLLTMAGPLRRLGRCEIPGELAGALDDLDRAAGRELACAVEALRTSRDPQCPDELEPARQRLRTLLGRLRDQGGLPDQNILDAALHLRRTRRLRQELRDVRRSV
ncbi:MAG: FUSC family protein [Desulfovibrionaceae bacterium]